MLKPRGLVRTYTELTYMHTCLKSMQRANIGSLFRVIRKNRDVNRGVTRVRVNTRFKVTVCTCT